MNGNIPNAEKNTHTSAVSRNPSRLPMSVREGLMPNVISNPVRAVATALMANASMSVSPYAAHAIRGNTRNAPSIIRSHPTTRSTMGKLIVVSLICCLLIRKVFRFYVLYPTDRTPPHGHRVLSRSGRSQAFLVRRVSVRLWSHHGSDAGFSPARGLFLTLL